MAVDFSDPFFDELRKRVESQKTEARTRQIVTNTTRNFVDTIKPKATLPVFNKRKRDAVMAMADPKNYNPIEAANTVYDYQKSGAEDLKSVKKEVEKADRKYKRKKVDTALELSEKATEARMRGDWEEYNRLVQQGTKSMDESDLYKQQMDARKTEDAYIENQKKIDKMQAVRNNPDFAISSAAGAGIQVPKGHTTAEIKNPVKYAKESGLAPVVDNATGGTPITYTGAPTKYKYLTDDEYAVYNYYLGRGEKKQAQEYLDLLDGQLNEREAAADAQTLKQQAKEKPALGVATNVASTLLSPLAYGATVGQNIKNAVTGEYEPIDPNSPYMRGVQAEQATREGLTEGKGEFAKGLINTGLSMGQFLSKVPMGPAALPYMAAGAAGQTSQEAAARGATAEQALQLGTISGLTEYATEKLPLENLLSLGKEGVKAGVKSTAKDRAKAAFKAVLKQASTEGTEEAISEYSGLLADRLIMGSRSEYDQYIKQLEEQGLTPQQAQSQALLEFAIKNPAASFAGGALSGGIMGAGGVAVGEVNTRRAGRNINQSGQLDTLIDQGLQAPKGSDLYNAADTLRQQSEKGQASNRDVGQFARQLQEKQLEQVDPGPDLTPFTHPQLDTESRAARRQAVVSKTADETQLIGVERLVKDAGLKLRYVNDPQSKVNGFIDGDTITVNVGNGDFAISTAVHEIGHSIKTGDPNKFQRYQKAIDRLVQSDPQYRQLAQDVVDTYLQKDGPAYNAMYDAEGNLNEALLQEEISLKLAEELISDPNKMVDAISKDRSLLDVFLDFVRGLKNKAAIKFTKSQKAVLDEAERTLVNMMRGYTDKVDGQRYSFVGENANLNAQENAALQQAKQLEQQSINSEDIRKKTGWFRGAEGKWRMEVDDSVAQYHQPNGNVATLGEVLEHPGLFATHPELKDVKVQFAKLPNKARGYFNSATNTIVLDSNFQGAPGAALLHEVQHALQKNEGFAGGGSPELGRAALINDAIYDVQGLPAYQKLQTPDERLKFIESYISLKSRTGDVEGAAYDRYRAIAGEVEASDTELRAPLSQAQRMETPPRTKGLVTQAAEVRSRLFDSYLAMGYSVDKSREKVGDLLGGIYQSGKTDDVPVERGGDRRSMGRPGAGSAVGSADILYAQGAGSGDPSSFEDGTGAPGNDGRAVRTTGGVPDTVRQRHIPVNKNSLQIERQSTSDGSDLWSYIRQNYGKRADTQQAPTVLATTPQQQVSTGNTGKRFIPLPQFQKGPDGVIRRVDIDGSGYGPNTVGAAQHDPTSYIGMQTEYGTIKPGENPARVVDVPKSTNGQDKVSQFARTVMEAKATPDSMISDFEQEVASGKFSYTPISNKSAQAEAKHIIESKGFDGALQQWRAIQLAKDAATKKDIVLGETLYTEAVARGDTQLAMQLAIELSVEGTRAGQAVQAMGVLKKLSPSGQLYYLQKVTDRLQSDLDHRMQNKAPTLKIDQQLAGNLLGAKTKADMEAAAGKIKRDLADQIPATWQDKWNAWRYLSMLGNPRTHIRNVLGNAMFVPVRKLKNMIGASIEASPFYTGDRSKAILTKKDAPLLNFAKADFEEVQGAVSGDGKMNPKSEILELRQIFKTGWLEKLRQKNSEWLEKEDLWFLRSAYTDSLAQYAKANGYTAEFLQSGTGEANAALSKAREYAASEAQKATYRDASKVASWLNNRSQRGAVTNLIVEGVLPFKKTPMNILKRGVEYSPIGILEGLAKASHGLKNGSITPAQFVDKISAGLTGSGIIGLGFFLTSMGLLSAGGGERKEDEFEKLQGGQNYALQIGDYSYTLDWSAPASMPLFVGAEFYKELNNKNRQGYSVTRFLDSLSKVTEPAFNMSMLDGVNSAIRSAGWSENPVTAIASNAATSYFTQAVPTFGGQVARTIDGTRRSTYTPKDSALPKTAMTQAKKVMAKVPGATFGLEPYVDKWGRQQNNGNIATRALQNFVSPGYISKKNQTVVDMEVERVYQKTSDSGVLPKSAPSYRTQGGTTYYLKEKEYTAYQTTMGQEAYSNINKLIRTKQYKKMTAAQQAKAIEKIYTYASEKANKQFFSGRGLSYDDHTVQRADNFSSPAEYALASTITSGVTGKKGSNGKTIQGSVKEAKIKELMNMGYSRNEAIKLYDKLN